MTRSSLLSGKIALSRSFSREASLWSCDGLFNPISRLQALRDCCRPNIVGGTGRSSIRVRNSSDGDWAKVSLVLGKVHERLYPSTILRFVMAIGVDTVDLVSAARTLPHVLKERDERSFPSFANRYPATAVLRKVLGVGIFASPLHTHPNTICRASFATNLVTMLQSAVGVCHSDLNNIRPLKGKHHLAKIKGWLL